MILLRPPEPNDPINYSQDENEIDDSCAAAIRMTYSPAEEKWRFTSSLSKPSEVPEDEDPDEIAKYMG